MKVGGTVDREGLNRRVLDVEPSDCRVGQAVGSEELGLRLAAITSLAIPPIGSSSIDKVAARTTHLNPTSRDRDQRTSPCFVAESSCALENNLGEVSNFRSMFVTGRT